MDAPVESTLVGWSLGADGDLVETLVIGTPPREVVEEMREAVLELPLDARQCVVSRVGNRLCVGRRSFADPQEERPSMLVGGLAVLLPPGTATPDPDLERRIVDQLTTSSEAYGRLLVDLLGKAPRDVSRTRAAKRDP